jgi:hypothetical protein
VTLSKQAIARRLVDADPDDEDLDDVDAEEVTEE